MAKNVKAGGAYYDLSVRNRLDQGLASAKARLKSFAVGSLKIAGLVTGAGVAIATPFLAAAKIFADAGDQLDEMSTRTGLSVKRLSELKFAADRSGTSIEAVEKASRGMAKMLFAAEEGSKGATDTLADLGLTLAQLQGRSPDEQFDLISQGIASIEDPTRRAALAMQAFGKSGAEVLPMFAGGADGLKQMTDEAHRLGVVLTKEDAASAAKLADAFDSFKATMKGVMVQIGAAVAGPLTDILNMSARVAASISLWIKNNHGLIDSVGSLASGIANAFKGGSIELAGEIAFTALKLVVANILAEIAGFFGDTLDTLLQGLGELSKRIAGVMAQLNSARVSGVNFLSGIIGAAVGVDTSPEQALATQQAQAFAGAMKDFQSRDIGAELQEAFDPSALTEKLNALKQQAKDLAEAAAPTPTATQTTSLPVEPEPVEEAIKKAQTAAAALGSFSVADLNQRVGKDVNRDLLVENKQQTEQLKIIARLLPGLALSYGP